MDLPGSTFIPGALLKAPSTHKFAGILSEIDGTLIDSSDAITKYWSRYLRF